MLEFDRWITENNLELGFEALYEKIYNFNQPKFTKEQLLKIQKDLMPGTIFAKE